MGVFYFEVRVSVSNGDFDIWPNSTVNEEKGAHAVIIPYDRYKSLLEKEKLLQDSVVSKPRRKQNSNTKKALAGGTGWTLERRLEQSERARRLHKEGKLKSKSEDWTPERRLKQSETAKRAYNRGRFRKQEPEQC